MQDYTNIIKSIVENNTNAVAENLSAAGLSLQDSSAGGVFNTIVQFLGNPQNGSDTELAAIVAQWLNVPIMEGANAQEIHDFKEQNGLGAIVYALGIDCIIEAQNNTENSSIQAAAYKEVLPTNDAKKSSFWWGFLFGILAAVLLRALFGGSTQN
jgi:hypothetical protein